MSFEHHPHNHPVIPFYRQNQRSRREAPCSEPQSSGGEGFEPHGLTCFSAHQHPSRSLSTQGTLVGRLKQGLSKEAGRPTGIQKKGLCSVSHNSKNLSPETLSLPSILSLPPLHEGGPVISLYRQVITQNPGRCGHCSQGILLLVHSPLTSQALAPGQAPEQVSQGGAGVRVPQALERPSSGNPTTAPVRMALGPQLCLSFLISQKRQPTKCQQPLASSEPLVNDRSSACVCDL